MRRPRPATWNLVVLFAVTALVGLWIRSWQLHGLEAMGWQDTHDYYQSSLSPWLSADLWAGLRTPAIPVLFKLTGGDGQNAMALQAVIAALCWGALATAVAAALPAGWRRWAAAALVIGVSLTSRTTMWDQSLLSETLALAFLALVAAAALQLAREVTPWRAAALVAASALWVAVRDAPSVALLAGAVAIGIVAVATRPHPPGRAEILAVTAVGLVAVAAVTMIAADHGGRGVQPLEHVFAVRILPYPDRVDWFADHGMPLADEIEALGPPAPVIPGGPLLKGVPDAKADRDFAPWHDWVRRSGQRTLLMWMATHPGYVVGEPRENPERSFNNAEGDLEFYRSPEFRDVPLIGLLSVRTAWLIPVGLLLAAALIWFARLGSPLVLVGIILAATSIPHGVAAWHSDGMETARHLVVPGMQWRLGILLLAAALLSRGAATPDADDVDAVDAGLGVGDASRERSQGLPVTGAMGTVAESSLAPIDGVDNVDGEEQNRPSRREVLDATEG
jgi:hypothetical protein